jgi:hypothetical protein
MLCFAKSNHSVTALQNNLECSANFCLSNIEQTKNLIGPTLPKSFAFSYPGRPLKTWNLHHRAMPSLGFDIFRMLHDGHPLWIAEVATLEEAKNNLHALALKSRGEYFIRDASNGEIVFKFASQD